MWHLRKLESSFEDARAVAENQEWLGTPWHVVSLPINRPQGVSVKALLFYLLRGSRIKQEITALWLFFSKVWLWGVLPCVPVLPGEAGGSVLQDLRQVEVQLALPAKNCCQESSEELGEIP